MKFLTTGVLLAASLGSLAAATEVTAPGARPVRLAATFSFTEGPSADRDGNVFFTDQPNDRIVRYGVDGSLADWLQPAGRSNGTHFDRAGNLLTCADGKNELWSIAPDRTITVLVRDFAGHRLNGPNDVWVAPGGAIYFTDPLYPRNYWDRRPEREQPGEYVYLLDRPTGRVRVVEQDVVKPNGIVGTPDGSHLYVADIGANRTYIYRIAPDGSLTQRKLFCALGSDGMTIDDEGNVYLTGHGVTIFNSAGQEIEHIDIPEPWTANLTFGGRDRRTLFITASKSIYTVAMRVRGTEAK
ncbi:MAG TPA: SMP-30/gluconolactonase/LRE family protein [Candidatus Didemnitutus sp.]|nr:SMP-30/gluconolactonase/LRE family protein [Candidatus Didemnitutus sp.]